MVGDGLARLEPISGGAVRVVGYESVAGATATSDGVRAWTRTSEGVVRLWDVTRGAVAQEWSGTPSGPPCRKESGDVVLATIDGTRAQVRDLATGSVLTSIAGNGSPITLARLAASGDKLLTIHSDGVALVWSLPQATIARALEVSWDDTMDDAALSPDGDVLAVLHHARGQARTLSFFDTATKAELYPGSPRPDAIDSIAFSPDGATLLVTSGRSGLAWPVPGARHGSRKP
jgi:WD40 repeat protein